MPKVDAWMPFYVADYLADTTRLSVDQHGAYFLLLIDYWRRGAPPDDDEILASICKTTVARWKQKFRQALVVFFSIKDGHWFQKRAEQEMAKANGHANAKIRAGKAGAHARWQNDGKRMPEAMPEGMAEGMAEGMHHSPSQSTIGVESPPLKSPPLPDWLPAETWGDFLEMRKQIKHPPNAKAIALLIAKLDRLRAAGNDPKDVLEQSIMNSYRSVFELKVSNERKTRSTKPTIHDRRAETLAAFYGKSKRKNIDSTAERVDDD